jgi:hypothetical protein
MPRYEVRFYDALNRVKVAVELDAADRHAAERAAVFYIRADAPSRIEDATLALGAVRELR